ncbi:hypothetical protein LH61_06435 [Leuconostoc mesenteroides P45]|uniref:collagen-binding domain-containing protein n=1 Tax=Leuconostoc mesenteroides TaxID=1245 RepID=UPI00050667EE|nr:collagen-binding domain-containing protein [Leuconostoc mesenteroides]KGB51107.1 hypothetical protein LH61_06435 [Leuconostoc mesenteroides P45]
MRRKLGILFLMLLFSIVFYGQISHVNADQNELPAAGNWKNDFPTVDNTKVLGIAGQFNVFAGDIDTTDSQVLQGNFATSYLKTKDWFVNGMSGISYLQNMSVNPGDYVQFSGDKTIIGSSMTYTSDFKWGNPGINNIRVAKTPSNGFRKDQVGQKYIDIDSELNRLSENSKSIAEYSKDNKPTVNNYYGQVTIDTTNIKDLNNIKYITLKPSDLPNTSARVSITGLSSNQKVAITFDTSGVNDINLAHLSFYNGTENRDILFNYYNISSMSAYQGQVDWSTIQSSATKYAVLAPQATVTLTQTSFQGNIIAKHFVNHFMGNQNGDFPDINVPSLEPPKNAIKLLSVPDLDFGTHGLYSQDSLIGSYQGNFKLSANKNDSLKINVDVTQPFTNTSGEKADKVTWQLLQSDYQSGKLVTTTQDMTTSSAQIRYWVWQDDGQGDLLSDWQWNEANKQNSFYKMQISNLQSVLNVGDYKATLRWTLTNSP